MASDPTTDPVRLADLWREAGWLHRVALQLGAEPSAADDLVQETLISASRHAPGEGGALRCWLRTTLRRRVSTLRRANERRRVREALAAKPESQSGRGADPLATLEADEVGRILAEAVAQLPQADREVLALRYAAGLSPAQIASSLGSTSSAVSSRLSRALRTLRERLEQQDRRSLGALFLALAPAIAMKKTTLVCAAVLMAIAALPLARRLASIGTVEPVEPVSQPVRLVDVARAEVTSSAPKGTEAIAAGSRLAAPVAKGEAPSAQASVAPVEAVAGSIHVTVTERQTGHPAPNVGMHVVRFHSGAFWSQKRALVTDELGRASLPDLAPGLWHVYLDRVPGPGESGVLDALVELGSRSELEFTVDRDAVIQGQVMDERGSPVAGATLRMTEGAGRMSETFPVAQSGDDGRFLIRYAGPMQMVGASAPGYGPSYSTCPAILEAVGRSTELLLTLRTLRGAVHGQVVGGDGMPIEGAMVTVRSGFGSVPDEGEATKGHWHSPPQICTSGADGRFAFEDVAVGRATLRARTPASALFSTELEVAPGLDHVVPVTLQSGGTVRGRISRADGGPGSGFPVRLLDSTSSLLSRTEALADSQGRYELQHLGPGPVELVVENDQFAEVATRIIEVPEGGSVTWDPVESAPVEIHGDLHAADGRPLHRWYISSRPMKGGEVGGSGMGARASKAGGFSILPALAESFDLTVYPPGRYFGKPALRLANYRPDGEALHLIVPQAEVPSATVQGRLCGPDGEPIAGVVKLTVKETQSSRELEVGDDGRFQFPYVTESALQLTLSSGTFPHRVVSVGDPLDADESRDLGDLVLTAE